MNIQLLVTAFKISLLLTFLLFSACSGGGGGGDGVVDPNRVGIVNGCSLLDYSDPATSEYILPYQVGMQFLVSQGNCGFITHQPACTAGSVSCGDKRYAYDFNTPIGIVILAARGGTVVFIQDGFSNNNNTALEENIIIIQHSDGTIAEYLHFTPNTFMVNEGNMVSQGDPIGISGNSGFTGGFPHLHFEVIESIQTDCTLSRTSVNANGGALTVSGCISVPVTFRNAQPLDAPLLRNRTYTALTF